MRQKPDGTYEDIKAFNQYPTDKRVVVMVGAPTHAPTPVEYYTIEDVPYSPGNELVPPMPEKTDYTDLMSANPVWAPGKPANTFRIDDLWHFVDLIRSRA